MPLTTSPISPGPPNPTTVSVGGYQDTSGIPGAWVERPRVTTADIPPCTPAPPFLNESPVSQAENGSVETTTLGELIEKLILPCTSISVSAIYLADTNFPLAAGDPKECQEAFFTTYTAFTTSDEVYQSLVHRFRDAEKKHSEHNVHLRIK